VWATLAALAGMSALCAGGIRTTGADTPAATPLTLRRVALLVPAGAESDPVQRLLQTERKAKGKRQRLSDLFAPAPSASVAGKSGDVASSLQGATLRALAEALFCDTLARQLHERLDIRVVPESETQAAITALRLSPAQAAEPEGARALCARLDCDAVLAPRMIRMVVREEKTRDLALWVAVQVAGLRLPDSRNERPTVSPPVRRRRPARRRSSLVAPPPEIVVAGAASSGHALFRSSYVRTRLRLVDDAAQQAAARAVHALWTGDSGPFMKPEDRIAVAPVPAPTQADQLLFTPPGRRVRPGGVRGLPADVSERFAPDLLPLLGRAVVPAEETRRALSHLALTPAALWVREDTPEIARVQRLGRKLGVDYLLLAHVTDIEMEEGTSRPQAGSPPGPAPGRPGRSESAAASGAVRERVARAETAGALVRIGDGAILWNDRATATMTVRPEDSLTAGLSDRQVAEDAIHFALLDLQWRFRRYRASFEH